jgi:hypothetical protein
MTAGEKLSREQRLRKQAELQSLVGTLANMRQREASYIDTDANIPEMFGSQVVDVQQKIEALETELGNYAEGSTQWRARQQYSDALKAELSGDLAKAQKLYKKAAGFAHPDANPAIRSVRYKMKAGKNKAGADAWSTSGQSPRRNRFFVWAAIILFIILVAILIFTWPSQLNTSQAMATLEIASTPTAVLVQLVIPNTPTPPPSATPTDMPVATDTPAPAPTKAAALLPSPTPPFPTDTPTPAATLRPAPRIIGPRDELVWKDGSIVFEFEPQRLGAGELYCLNTMRGFDQTNTENWSYQPIGTKDPFIPVEANVFRIAAIQGIQCIMWSAAIGRDSCDTIVSRSTEMRTIGMPRPCKF